MHVKAASLVRPSTLRRAQTGVVRLITVVAGHWGRGSRHRGGGPRWPPATTSRTPSTVVAGT